MVSKPKRASKSFRTNPQTKITVGELISRLLPRFEDARKRGFESFRGNKEHPLIYGAGPSESDLLRVLNMFRSALHFIRPPESRGPKQSPPSGNIQITSDWILPSNEVGEISARLETLFAYDGLQYAVAQWRQCEGRITLEEVFQRMRMSGRTDSAFLEKMIQAELRGDLRTYAPGKDYLSGLALQDEVYKHDLDASLEKNEPHIRLRFSAASKLENTIKPVSRKDANKARLLVAIKECGGDHNDLPNGQSGVPGLKAKVRKHVGATFTTATFNSSWKEVRRDGREAAAANIKKAPPVPVQ